MNYRGKQFGKRHQYLTAIHLCICSVIKHFWNWEKKLFPIKHWSSFLKWIVKQAWLNLMRKASYWIANMLDDSICLQKITKLFSKCKSTESSTGEFTWNNLKQKLNMSCIHMYDVWSCLLLNFLPKYITAHIYFNKHEAMLVFSTWKYKKGSLWKLALEWWILKRNKMPSFNSPIMLHYIFLMKKRNWANAFHGTNKIKCDGKLIVDIIFGSDPMPISVSNNIHTVYM